MTSWEPHSEQQEIDPMCKWVAHRCAIKIEGSTDNYNFNKILKNVSHNLESMQQSEQPLVNVLIPQGGDPTCFGGRGCTTYFGKTHAP